MSQHDQGNSCSMLQCWISKSLGGIKHSTTNTTGSQRRSPNWGRLSWWLLKTWRLAEENRPRHLTCPWQRGALFWKSTRWADQHRPFQEDGSGKSIDSLYQVQLRNSKSVRRSVTSLLPLQHCMEAGSVHLGPLGSESCLPQGIGAFVFWNSP